MGAGCLVLVNQLVALVRSFLYSRELLFPMRAAVVQKFLDHVLGQLKGGSDFWNSIQAATMNLFQLFREGIITLTKRPVAVMVCNDRFLLLLKCTK